MLILGLSIPTALHGQSSKPNDGFLSHTEVALDYNYEHGKVQPAPTFGGTGFSMSGVSATGAYAWKWHLSGVVDFSGVHVNGIGQTGLSLTLLTSTLGARYTLPATKKLSLKPYLQLLAGEGHATGGIYPANPFTSGGADGFAFIAGTGLDHPLTHVVALRAGLSYLYTGLPNGSSNYQSYVRAEGGLVFQLGAR